MYTTAEVAEQIGVSKNTLLRWLAEGRLADVPRDWRNWRVWHEADLARARAVRDELHGDGVVLPRKPMAADDYPRDLSRLAEARLFRPTPVPALVAKPRVMERYAADLERLGEGRSYRGG